MNTVHNFITDKSKLARENPDTVAFVVCGDFNLRFSKPSLDLATGKLIQSKERENRQAKKLISSLCNLTRIEHDQHSHYLKI